MAGIWGAKGFTSRSRPSDFLKSVLQNGVGRYVQQLQRITLQFCPKSPESKEVRDFVENGLVDFARANPGVVVYVTPESESDPKLCAEFLNGRSEVQSLERLTENEIGGKVNILKNRSGLEIVRLRKSFHTDFPSIQGEWTPFRNLKNYDVKYKPQTKVFLTDTWDPVGNPWKGLYRKHELEKITNRPKLTFTDREELPLGKWGPVLKPKY